MIIMQTARLHHLIIKHCKHESRHLHIRLGGYIPKRWFYKVLCLISAALSILISHQLSIQVHFLHNVLHILSGTDYIMFSLSSIKHYFWKVLSLRMTEEKHYNYISDL